MEKKQIIDELIEVCFELGIFKVKENIEQKRESIKIVIEDISFIETFYIEIYKKAKALNILNKKKILNVLLKLEKARLELEATEDDPINSNKISL